MSQTQEQQTQSLAALRKIIRTGVSGRFVAATKSKRLGPVALVVLLQKRDPQATRARTARAELRKEFGPLVCDGVLEITPEGVVRFVVARTGIHLGQLKRVLWQQLLDDGSRAAKKLGRVIRKAAFVVEDPSGGGMPEADADYADTDTVEALDLDDLQELGLDRAEAESLIAMRHTVSRALDLVEAQTRRVPIRIQIGDFEKRLSTAAKLAKSKGVGNGRYSSHRSSMRPVVAYLTDHRSFGRAELDELTRLLDALSDETQAKYRGPLKSLRRIVARAGDSLVGPAGPESVERRRLVALALDEPAGRGPMTPDELRALYTYKKPGGYAGVNAGLRALATFTKEDFEQTLLMISGMRRLDPHTEPVFRGADCLIGGVKSAEVGQVYSDGAFLSTSMHKKKAFKAKFKMCIVGSHSLFDVSGETDVLDPNDVNIAAMESEALGLPGMKVRYLGYHDDWHHYEEVSSPPVLGPD